jgi:hypothetical protein
MIQMARRYSASVGDSTRAVLKLDIHNAFNEIDRGRFLEEIQLHCPEALNYAMAAYGSHSWCMFGDTVISSEQGAQQGDPSASLYFALALARCRLDVHASVPSDRLLDVESWFADDGIMGGPADVVRQFLDAFLLHEARYGLRLNLAKCEIICSTPATRELFADIALTHTFDAWTLLGVPVGNDRRAVEAWGAKVLEAAARKCRRISALTDCHKAFCLLRFCGGFSLTNFLLRSIGYIGCVEAYDLNFRGCTERIIGPMDDLH